jgi:hypothetical protein
MHVMKWKFKIQKLLFLLGLWSVNLFFAGCLSSSYRESRRDYVRVRSVEIAEDVSRLNAMNIYTGQVGSAWSYGHVAWFNSCALGNVRPFKYTQHIKLTLPTSTTYGVKSSINIMQTLRATGGYGTRPKEGLFKLQEGDKVLFQMSTTMLQRNTQITILPIGTHGKQMR